MALASTIFISSAKSLLKTGHSPAAAFTSGYQDAFWVLIALALTRRGGGVRVAPRDTRPATDVETEPVRA